MGRNNRAEMIVSPLTNADLLAVDNIMRESPEMSCRKKREDFPVLLESCWLLVKRAVNRRDRAEV